MLTRETRNFVACPMDALAGVTNVPTNAVWILPSPVRGLFSRDLMATATSICW